MKRVRQQLARLLGCSVRADGQVDRVGFAKRAFGPVAVDTRAGRVMNRGRGVEPARRFEPGERSQDVDFGVEPGSAMLGRTPARAARCTIASGRVSCTTSVGSRGVPDVELDQPEPRVPPGLGQVGFLLCAVVELVEVVDADHFATVRSRRSTRCDPIKPAPPVTRFSRHSTVSSQ